MRNDKNDVVPSTSTCLFPDLLTREEILAILWYKFRKIGVNSNKIVKLTDDELLKQFKKFVMPKPQRKGCISYNSLENVKDSNNSVNKLKISSSTCSSRVNAVNGRFIAAYGKRHSISSSIEHSTATKRVRKHSPIRFP